MYFYKKEKISFMLVREKTPDKILVKTDTLKMAISEDKNQKELKAEYANSKDIFEFAGGGFFTCLLTLFSSWNELKKRNDNSNFSYRHRIYGIYLLEFD